MSEVWGSVQLKLEKDGSTLVLENAILTPDFFLPAEIMHEGCINAKRTWSKDRDFSEFAVVVQLFKHNDPNAKAAELLGLRKSIYLFTPFDMLWSRYVVIISVVISPIDPLSDKEIAIIEMVSIDPGALGDYMQDKAGNRYKTKAGQYIRRRIKGI